MLEDSTDDLYEDAPCGNVSTLLDGTVARINRTLLSWLGYGRDEVVGLRRFSDLLTVGGRIYYETHYAPLLTMQGEVGGVALDLRAKDGRRLPVLVSSTVKTGGDGRPLLIRTTVYDARDRRAYEEELLRARRAAEAAEQAAHQDRQRLQKLVASLQRSLLPRKLAAPPGMDVAAHYQAASADEVGGDFYDLFPLDGDRWGFFLGDVCGKGVEAAAVTALARYTLRAAAVYDPDPGEVLSNLNTVLYQEYLSGDHRSCTVVFGVLGPPTGEGRRVTVTGGGHPPALLLTAAGAADYVPTSGGPLVGMFAGLRFTAHTLMLRPGDTLILYTDGLTDARTDDAGRYGHEALLEFAASIAPASAAAAVAALAGLLGGFGADLDDDAAIMALGVTG
ncbi:SpoIIE family protein phosphatase [Catellatospora sp. KI3]|uniref:PP2C family protein-serine/threonine phosphatase n=1 Tax=Catellatospora sp. KI3 TaxID=3041620 RepID=UPI00248229B4|nr:SpoIIE family protein phosphatase [Catellatospora sp. KI3]MDI1460867.1 SpoIIE family protein phosphatase [Catellatospora sp. KI3]